MNRKQIEITPENSATIAAIDGYKNGLEHGNEAFHFTTIWAGTALESYKLGITIALQEVKKNG